MAEQVYRYTFRADVPPEDLEASLLLARFAVEGLHGEAQVRLDAAHGLDAGRRACAIDATTAVGRDLNRVFVNFVRREFGEGAFRVERVTANPPAQPQEVAP